MCGIGYAITFDGSPVNDTILKRYKNQRLRGIEGFGIYDRTEDNIIKTPKEEKFVGWLHQYKSNDLLFHHRTPTSAPNVKNACHPFSTGDRFDKTYILVHNGWINNAERLANEHDAFKINYTSLQANLEFNDSEALVWDFALWREGLIPEMKSVGAIAFICIVKDEDEDKLYFYRNNNPLKAIINVDGITLSSEGEGESVPEDTLFCYDYNTKLLTFENLELSTYDKSFNNSTFPGSQYPTNYTNYDRWNDDELSEVSSPDKDKQTHLLDDGYELLYTYPFTKKAIESLWPREKNIAIYSLKHVKGVVRYLNRKLSAAAGSYDDAYDAIEKECNMYEKLLKNKHNTVKDILRYKQQLKIATIAQEVILTIPTWQLENQAVDPAFDEGWAEKGLEYEEN